jgi:hypothetical protein
MADRWRFSCISPAAIAAGYATWPLRERIADEDRAARSTAMPLTVDVTRRDNALCRMHRASPRIGGRNLGAQVGPRLEVIKCVNDPPADLAVLRPRPVSAVLLECAAGQAEESRRLWCAQEARRQAGKRIRHDVPRVVL